MGHTTHSRECEGGPCPAMLEGPGAGAWVGRRVREMDCMSRTLYYVSCGTTPVAPRSLYGDRMAHGVRPGQPDSWATRRYLAPRVPASGRWCSYIITEFP